jgi:hypothetical protein
LEPHRPIDDKALFWWEFMPTNARNNDAHKRKNDKDDKCRAESDAPLGIVEGYFKERYDYNADAKREPYPDAVSERRLLRKQRRDECISGDEKNSYCTNNGTSDGYVKCWNTRYYKRCKCDA